MTEQERNQKIHEKLEKLARVFNDSANPYIVPTKPDDKTSPLSLPPSKLQNFANQKDASEVVEERVETLTNLAEPNLTKEQTQPNPGLTHSPQGLTDKQSLLTKENEGRIQEETIQELPQPVKRGRGRPKGSKNKVKRLEQSPLSYVQQGQPQEESTAQPTTIAVSVDKDEKLSNGKTFKKLSKNFHEPQGKSSYPLQEQHLCVETRVTRLEGVKNKTSLYYTLLYSATLSPHNITLLLEKQEDLCLTASEIIALDLVDRTLKHDQKAEKIYWDLVKKGDKNDKITPIKSENTLLDEALAKAEDAIFGEIVDNPDNP